MSGRPGVPGYASGPDAPLAATAQALERAESARCVVLVEGVSDQIAVETLAARLGHDLAASGVAVVPIGGAQAVSQYATRFGPARIIGLCDAAEERFFASLSAVFVCHADLEDELIRAAGRSAIEILLAANGDATAFWSMSHQPAWRDRPFEAQMRRFLGAGSRRKSRYAQLLVSSIPLEQIPHPLRGVLEAAPSSADERHAG